MNNYLISRRQMLRALGFPFVGGSLAGISSCNSKKTAPVDVISPGAGMRPFRISLNTSTISGYKLPVPEQIALCGEAGFDGIELWIRDIVAYLDQGGDYETLSRLLKDNELILENMISFSTWIADNKDKREEGIEGMRKDMETTARLGGRFIAATVQGLSSIDRDKLPDYAERYRTILEMGDEMGVTPLLELWGAGVLNSLPETVYITLATGHSKAVPLLDFYHLYRGGNPFESLSLINGSRLPVFHINDYPAQPPRKELKDSDRVFPGDGICPFANVLPSLYQSGFRGALSVELFNKGYWETMSAREVLKTSYDKTATIIDTIFNP